MNRLPKKKEVQDEISLMFNMRVRSQRKDAFVLKETVFELSEKFIASKKGGNRKIDFS